MLLGGDDEGAARGLLAAFAWAAADIARAVRPSAVLDAVADVVGWQGFAVSVVAPADASGVLHAAADGTARPHEEAWRDVPPSGPWVAWAVHVDGRLAHFLVVEAAASFTPATIDALAAFVRLAETTLGRIAKETDLQTEIARREASTRCAIASERLAVLGEAAAVLAHELRNPLGTIANAVTLLDRPAAGDRDVARSIIRDEVARLDALVKDLLHLARPVDRAQRRVDLADLVRTTLDRARKDLNGTHVLVAPTALPEAVEVTGDPALLGLVLENVVRNAAQAAPRDSQIRIEIAPRPADVTVSVEDDGPGIARALEERIFEPFFTTRAVGTGLGLSIVKRLVEAHGGSVKVGASRSGGARFDLVFARSK